MLERLPYGQERMGAMGWSYGGYMMSVVEDTHRFKRSDDGFTTCRNVRSTRKLWFPEWDWEAPGIRNLISDGSLSM
jgi:dipeptidyl aminopeptidase/acylaminoacyl peptidase